MSNNKDKTLHKTSVGGQALIEGIMMQGPKGAAVSVRTPDGEIDTEMVDFKHAKDKFYKVDNNIRGTGIGLAVADEIIKMHSGEMNIFSEVAKGTTVEIILPIIVKED